MANNPLLDKVMADYGQYLNKPAQGFAEGGNVPVHEANLKAYEEALANRPKIEKEKYSYKGYPLTYKNGKWEEDVPDTQVTELVPIGIGGGSFGGAMVGSGFGGGFGMAPQIFNAQGQPYRSPSMGNFMGGGFDTGPQYTYRTRTEPGYLLQYEYDPRQYEWDQYGRNIGKKPTLFGGSLGGLSMAGLGEDMFKVGSSVQGGFAEGGEVKGYAGGGQAKYMIDYNTLGGRMFGGTGVIDKLPQSALNEILNNPGMRMFMGFSPAPQEPRYYSASAPTEVSNGQSLADYEKIAGLNRTTPNMPQNNTPLSMGDLYKRYYEGGSPFGNYLGSGFAKGGMVKGYAEGGEYDPENPDFAGQVRENMNQNLLYNMREPVVPNVQVTAPAPVARPSAVEEALMQRRAIMADLNKALSAAPASTGMTDAEKYFRLAGAFGKTGKTGHFAESLASVGDTMADIQAEKRKEAREQAALGLQRLQSRAELANQQYALAREGEMQDLLKKYINKGQGVTDQVTAGAADDGIPDDVKALILAQPTDKAVATIIDMAKEANKPSDLIRGVKFLVKQGAISSEEGAQIVKENLQGKLEQLDVTVPELGGTVKLTGPEARKYYESGELPTRFGGKAKPAAVTETAPTAPTAGKAKVAADVNNPSGIRKNGEFVAYNTPSEGISATHGLVSRYLDGKGPMSGIPATPENVVGVWTNNDPTMGAKVMGGSYASAIKQELNNLGVKLNADGTIPNTPLAVTAVSNAIIKNESGPKASKFLGGEPAQKAAPAVMTQEQIEAKKTGLVEQSKKDIEASDALLSQKSFAKQQKDAAREVLGFANKSPKAFGVIADPTWSNAVANLVETGVNTPWGSVGLAVEEPIAKLKLTGPEAATRQLAARPIALIEVGYRKMFLKGEGAVSNMEGALTKYLGPQLSDTAKVVQIKAGMIAIGADKQEKIVDAFERYKETHPEAGPRSFYQTPEYKRIVETYENKYKSFAEKNGIPVGDVDQAPAKGGSFSDAIKAERARRQSGNK